jgi:hypothetical protein
LVATVAENRLTDHQANSRLICSHQPSAEHFQQCAEFLPLRNRGFGTLAVTVLPIPFARKGRRYRVRRRATDNVFSSSCFEQTIPRG